MLVNMGEGGTLTHCRWEFILLQPLWKSMQRTAQKAKSRSTKSSSSITVVFTQRVQYVTTEILSQSCSLLLYSQQLRKARNLNVLQLSNGQCGSFIHIMDNVFCIYTQWVKWSIYTHNVKRGPYINTMDYKRRCPLLKVIDHLINPSSKQGKLLLE